MKLPTCLDYFRYDFAIIAMTHYLFGMYVFYHSIVCFQYGPCIDVSDYALSLSIFLFAFSGSLFGMVWVNPITEHGVYVCLRCEQSFFVDKLTDYRCPECGSRVERLEHFYDRHPDKRPPILAEPSDQVLPAPALTEQSETPTPKDKPAKQPLIPKIPRMGILKALREYRAPAPRKSRFAALSGAVDSEPPAAAEKHQE